MVGDNGLMKGGYVTQRGLNFLVLQSKLKQRGLILLLCVKQIDLDRVLEPVFAVGLQRF